MRILQVIPTLSKGGAERVVVELANASVDSGYEITVLLAYPVDYDLNQRFLESEITVFSVSPKQVSRLTQYVKLPFWVAKNWRALKGFDVIHCHLTFGLVLGLIVSARRKISGGKNPKLVATCHMVGMRGNPERFNRACSYFFDSFVLMALDSKWRRFIETSKCTNIHIVPNGISTAQPVSQLKRRTNRDPFVIGTISRLDAERRPWLFLEVFAEILKSDPNGNYRFIIGGDGEERERLERLSAELNLNGKLIFAGLVKEPNEILFQVDLYVTLNVEGITGIAGLEAVFSGLPVIAIQLSPEYSTGDSDWIWSSKKPKNVAEKILELAQDRAETQKMSSRQHLYAYNEYSTQRMMDGYRKIYKA
jgi:glycosyltransferase involved in cell wall biosynthesis